MEKQSKRRLRVPSVSATDQSLTRLLVIWLSAARTLLSMSRDSASGDCTLIATGNQIRQTLQMTIETKAGLRMLYGLENPISRSLANQTRNAAKCLHYSGQWECREAPLQLVKPFKAIDKLPISIPQLCKDMTGLAVPWMQAAAFTPIPSPCARM